MKKEKVKKPKKTAKQRLKTLGKVLLIILIIIALIYGAVAVLNLTTVKGERNFIENSVKPAEYAEQLVPELDEDGFYTFTTDRDFKVVQFTDVHLGSGCITGKKDTMALNAVAAMVEAEKPDLVVVTGDVAYPVPFQSLTFNNKPGAVTFAELMEKLGVYWCMVYGNHDTEAYSYYTRKQISEEIYGNKEKYPHCLFQSGPEDIEGYGNYVVNVKNSIGQITQSLFFFDSLSYTDGDYFGIQWKYDAIHEDQINWYKETLAKITEENANITPKSLAFFHIPPLEMREAYYEYRDAGFKDTKDVKYIYGKAGEKNLVVYSSAKNFGLFDAFLEGKSTQGVFFGHDHVNNISLDYKGIKMTYGYSIDYLAYSGIYKYGLQRGCTIINLKQDGSFDYHGENYYQDKYVSPQEKETVDLETEYGTDDSGVVNPLANGE